MDTISFDSNGGILMKGEHDESVFVDCPISNVQKIVRGKWAMVIIYFLSQGTIRFGELSRKIPQVTQANLTKELRMLEEYGLVHREVYREVPPKVEYSLTAIGQKFLPVIKALEIWADEYERLE
jgi:DNA-binding HxlR family transcriptional regulator